MLDARKSETEYFRRIPSQAAKHWLKDSIQEITDNDVQFVNDLQEGVNPMVIELRHAYTKNKAQSKTGVVSIKVIHNGREEFFRGNDSGMSWIGIQAEYTLLLNKVLHEALWKFAKSPNFCVQSD